MSDQWIWIHEKLEHGWRYVSIRSLTCLTSCLINESGYFYFSFSHEEEKDLKTGTIWREALYSRFIIYPLHMTRFNFLFWTRWHKTPNPPHHIHSWFGCCIQDLQSNSTTRYSHSTSKAVLVATFWLSTITNQAFKFGKIV